MEEETKTCCKENEKSEEQKPSCCKKTENKKEPKGFLSGLLYGLIPHTGCIAFILFTILGVTAVAKFFKPLLLNPYFFYILIALSFIFATISAIIYLKRCQLFSLNGAKQKWKYLSVLYGTTIGINLLLFMVIFPIAANIASAAPTGAAIAEDSSEITLKVKIPCPGHAPLINEELKTIDGVKSVKFRFPNYFDVKYDSKTSQKEILSLEVFNTYPATKISGEEKIQKQTIRGCSVCSTCSGACGGTCGGV